MTHKEQQKNPIKGKMLERPSVRPFFFSSPKLLLKRRHYYLKIFVPLLKSLNTQKDPKYDDTFCFSLLRKSSCANFSFSNEDF